MSAREVEVRDRCITNALGRGIIDATRAADLRQYDLGSVLQVIGEALTEYAHDWSISPEEYKDLLAAVLGSPH